MEETAALSEPKNPLLFLPYILGGVGILFLVMGAYLTINKSSEKPKITITDSLSNLSSPSNPSTPSQKILVDVSGAVEKPGVYELPEGSRFQNALVLAGGLSEDADRDYVDKYINLAAKLTDGGKIYIPKLGETSNPSTSLRTSKQQAVSNNSVLGLTTNDQSPIASLININTASLSDLDTLSGVGPVTAQKIIDNRPYSKIEELLEKKIVGNSVWEKIKDRISIY